MLSLCRACFFLVFLFHSNCLTSAQQPQYPFPLTININQGQSSNATNSNNNDNANLVENISKNAVQTKIETNPEDSWKYYFKEMYKIYLQKYNSKKTSFTEFLKNNPFKITCGVVGGCYLYLLYNIKKYKKIMYNPESWCCWNYSIETTELTMLPHSKVYGQLIEDIQNKYLLIQNKIDFSDPLEQFMKDIKKEIQILRFYIKLHKIIYRFHIPAAFFLKNTTCVDAEEKLRRATYIYNTFIAWHTKHNIHKLS